LRGAEKVEIVELNALPLSQAIRAREVSCFEVMRAYLDAIAARNGTANAIVSLRPEESLLAEAAEADRALAAGAPRGWLHGVPQAVKDLAPVRGLPFTQGSPIFRDRVADADGPFAARMRAAGAIFVGKTNTPEFGLGSQTYNAVFGATRNPYDPALTAGGSSGGAAAALALRMLPVADGSDHAGSLRNPAAFNNVFGLRPGMGRVVDGFEDVFLPKLTVAGPMARSVEDLAALLAVMAGPDPRAPLAVEEDPSIFLRPLDRDVAGLRFGWLGDFGGHLPIEPGVLELCEAAARVFEELGARVEPAAPEFSMEGLFQAWRTLRHWQVGAALAPLWEDEAKRALMKPEAVWEVEGGRRLGALEASAASAVRSAWYAEVLRLFERFDYLLLPSAQVFPFPVETHWPREVGGRTMDTYHRWMEVVIPVTMSGCPAISVPAGFGARGLPMGLQIWGPWRGELGLLQVARAYERATGWVERRPPPMG
jgi:amidase